MEYTEFPAFKDPNSETKNVSIYSKAYSLASNVFQTFKREEDPKLVPPPPPQDSRPESLHTSELKPASIHSHSEQSNNSFQLPKLSDAQVGISTELAVPELPAPSISDSTPQIDLLNVNPRLMNDSESIVSSNSKSQSRVYLSLQLSKNRTRASSKQLSKEFWMKDDNAYSCYFCNKPFNALRRKHHCRICGQIFCSSCTNLVDGKLFGIDSPKVRCCRECEENLGANSEGEGEEEPDQTNTTINLDQTLSDDELEEEMNDEIYSMNTASPGPKEDSYTARSFLLTPSNRSIRMARSVSLSKDDDLRSLRNSLSAAPSIHTAGDTSNLGSGVLHSVPSSSQLNIQDSTSFPISTAMFPNSETVELNSASTEYLALFLDQILKDSELDAETWRKIVEQPLHKVATGLHLELNGQISPRDWVKIKRIPGGNPEYIDCINGIVFTHSLVRSTMPTKINRPRIMLITFPVEYSRPDKYMSLDSIIAQEGEYLRKLVTRIVNFRPTLLLSCSYVCGKAIDMLEEQGVAVAHNMRYTALQRLKYLTNADILNSADGLSTFPRIGTCQDFEVRSYRYEEIVKTFLFFFVNEDRPGRCALIRGDPAISSTIKIVMEVMTEICYSLKAETALMRDQFALVPAELNKPSQVMSSSPFVSYGTPYLLRQVEQLKLQLSQLMDLKQPQSITDYVLEGQISQLQMHLASAEKEWQSFEVTNPFMFNPSSHQNLLVLYNLINTATSTPCVGPEIELIEFYLNTDETIGQFVENIISECEMTCPEECGKSLLNHYRQYSNGFGSIMCKTIKLDHEIISGLENSILMWSECKQCDQKSPAVPMSSTTWKYSFGKYLELAFYGEPMKMRASSCPHDMYKQHTRYFAWKGFAITVEFVKNELNELQGPPKSLNWDCELEVKMKNSEIESIETKIKEYFSSLMDALDRISIEGLDDQASINLHQTLARLHQKVVDDQSLLLESLYTLAMDSKPYDYLSLYHVYEHYRKLDEQWHNDFNDIDNQFFPSEKDIKRVTIQHILGMLGEEPSERIKQLSREKQPGQQQLGQPQPDQPQLEKPSESSEPSDAIAVPNKLSAMGLTSVPHTPPSVQLLKSKLGNNIRISLPGLESPDNRRDSEDMQPELQRQYQKLSEEFEKEFRKERQQYRHNDTPSKIIKTLPVAEVFEDVSENHDWGPISERRLDLHSPIPSTKSSICDYVPSDLSSEPKREVSPAVSNHFPTIELTNPPETKAQETNENIKKSIAKSLASFWAERSTSKWSGIKYMLDSREHYFMNSPVILRDSEPTSLIAFCLSLPDYVSRMKSHYEKFEPASEKSQPESQPQPQPQTDPDSQPDLQPDLEPELNNSDPEPQPSGMSEMSSLEKSMLRSTGTHMRYHFDGENVKVSCKIFFCEQFDALRRACMPIDKYVQSLSRCTNWENAGGKSGSAFMKTMDDRFVIKELNQAEFDSFANFAPSYFEYMAQALFHDLPTLMAKLFGVYQLIIRNANKSQPTKMYVLVMENLFYGQNLTKLFDLKGSMRNRKVAETGKANEVLLDENMVEYIYNQPLFLREHSKRTLRASLYNDTLFLTKMNVMDYSLIIGLNKDNSRIVAGVIDYIRTYTWDKKIETWVKAKAAPTNIKEPTVISPKQYKGRFRESMERYFVMIPDCWSKI